MASVDADFEQPLLEPHRAPYVAASRGEFAVRRLVVVAIGVVGVKYIAFQGLAGLRDESAMRLRRSRNGSAKTSSRVSRWYRIVCFCWWVGFPGKKPAAVHGLLQLLVSPTAAWPRVGRGHGMVLLINGMVVTALPPRRGSTGRPSDFRPPESLFGICFASSSIIGCRRSARNRWRCERAERLRVRGNLRIEGYAIASVDGMIADATGFDAASLEFEADQRFFLSRSIGCRWSASDRRTRAIANCPAAAA